MSDLYMAMKGIYFDQIAAGTKLEEYRLCNPYWARRLHGRLFSRIILTRGYPARDDASRRLVMAWKGCTTRTITHPHFGDTPVRVIVIDVSGIREEVKP